MQYADDKALPWELIERLWPKLWPVIDCWLCPSTPHVCGRSDAMIREWLRQHPEDTIA